jgi:translation initiation factor IF-2
MFLLTTFQKHFISTTIPRLRVGRVTPLSIKKANELRKMMKIKVKREMTIGEISKALNKPVDHIYECIEKIGFNNKGISLNENYLIKNFDYIQDILRLSGFRASLINDFENEEREEIEELKYLEENDEYIDKRPKAKNLVKRSPIVTIMGHVDHGKTTLLDALRNTNVVATEFGGITQHIGAFNCSLMSSSDKQEKTITFLDTPGHAAFMSMRARGARLTDIIVLVIAADDGIMEQTIESIRLAKESNCAIIVAINKIDKTNETQIRKLKQDLIKYDLQTEDIGGDIQCVHISALKKQNIEVLKEEIWTLAEIMELKGDPTPGLVEGYIIESYQDPNRGKLASAIIKRGTLNKNSYLVSGTTYCKVKQMLNDKMKPMNQAFLSNAVLLMGWKDLPEVGSEILEVSSEKRAREVIEIRLRKNEIKRLKEDFVEIQKKKQEYDLEYQKKLAEKRARGYRYRKRTADERIPERVIIDNAKNHILSVVIKTDVNGTLEAILNILDKYECEKVKLDVVHFDVGPVTKSDIELAELFGSIIYCFNIPSESNVVETEKKNYQIKHFNIIYKLFDDIKIELEKVAPLVALEEVIGEAEFTNIFEIKEKKENIYIGGGRCLNGLIDSKKYFRIIRDGQTLFEKEKSKTLKHMKTVVQTIKKGSEFGLGFENLSIIPKVGDRIICYDIKMVNDKIEWNIGF